MAATERAIIQGPLFTGGLNDTDLPILRKENEARTQINCRVRPDGALEKIKGRESAITGFADEITGLIVPPADQPLATIDDSNNALYAYISIADPQFKLVKLAKGKYYTYEALATALQTALRTLSSLFYVTYLAIKKFEIKIGHASAVYAVCWNMPGAPEVRSTIDASLFGFDFGVSATGYVQCFGRVVDDVALYKRLFATKNKLYNESMQEINMVKGDSPRESDKFWTGIWNNERWYGSNGRDSYILRDGKYLRKQLRKGMPLPALAVESFVKPASPYDYSYNASSVELNQSNRWARLKIGYGGNHITTAAISLDVDWGVYTDYSIRVYHEIPSRDFRELIGIYRYSKSSVLDLLLFKTKRTKLVKLIPRTHYRLITGGGFH